VFTHGFLHIRSGQDGIERPSAVIHCLSQFVRGICEFSLYGQTQTTRDSDVHGLDAEFWPFRANLDSNRQMRTTIDFMCTLANLLDIREKIILKAYYWARLKN
jgi:hypothetical protein